MRTDSRCRQAAVLRQSYLLGSLFVCLHQRSQRCSRRVLAGRKCPNPRHPGSVCLAQGDNADTTELQPLTSRDSDENWTSKLCRTIGALASLKGQWQVARFNNLFDDLPDILYLTTDLYQTIKPICTDNSPFKLFVPIIYLA